MPTYSIIADATEVNEGTIVTFTVATTEVADSTVLYWTIAGTDVNASDFVSATTSGSVTITGNAASFTTTVKNDIVPEGYEYYIVQLRTDSIAGEIVAVSQNIAIIDTSTGGIVDDPENGKLRSITADTSKPAYYVNGVWYKVSGTAIPL